MHESYYLYGLVQTSNKDMDTQTHPIHTSQNSTPLGEWRKGGWEVKGGGKRQASTLLIVGDVAVEGRLGGQGRWEKTGKQTHHSW